MPENHMKIIMFINRDVEQIIRAKQFDALSRFLDVTLLDDAGSPYDLTDCRIQFNARKEDGTSIMNNATIINEKSGQFSIELTDQTLAIGNSIIKADISVFSNDARLILTTRTFLIHVQATIRADDAVESSNEYNSVVILFQDVWDMREIIREMNERFGTLTDDLMFGDEQAGSSALGGLNRIWNYLKTQSTAGIVETVNHIKNVLGNANPVSGNSNTVMNYLHWIHNKSPIKSIQRGTAVGAEGGITITISSVNPSKCLVLFNGTWSSQPPDSYAVFTPYLVSLDSTQFAINGVMARYASLPGFYPTFSWQIIEFN